MSYIGSTPTTQSFIAGTDSFNGTGSATNFTLTRSVNSTNDIQVVVNNVVQYPPNYSVSGTTLTISPAPSAGTNNVYVRYLSTTLQSITVPGGSTVVGNFSVTDRLGVGTAFPIRTLTVSQPTSPEFVLQESSGATNAKNWRIFNSSNTLIIGTLNDAGTSGSDCATITSAGNITTTGTLTTASRGIAQASVPAGSVLQVTWTNWAGSYTATSSTNVDFTGFSATFTPLFSTSKVLIIVSAGINIICDGIIYIKRNGSIVKDNWFGSSRQDDQYDYPQATQTYLDSPGTTSTVTYQMGGRSGGCSNTIRFGASDNSSSILFMEIAA